MIKFSSRAVDDDAVLVGQADVVQARVVAGVQHRAVPHAPCWLPRRQAGVRPRQARACTDPQQAAKQAGKKLNEKENYEPPAHFLFFLLLCLATYRVGGPAVARAGWGRTWCRKPRRKLPGGAR